MAETAALPGRFLSQPNARFPKGFNDMVAGEKMTPAENYFKPKVSSLR
ncbi:hypothetical protein ACVCNR_08590 [Aquamicrobium terrae]